MSSKYSKKELKLTWNSWDAMKDRCINPKTNGYHRYGGKGIKVCDRWLNDFLSFVEDMGLRPSKEHTLDRYPDRHGNYEPSNCRWATREEQIANMDRTVIINYNNEIIPVFILAKKFNISSKLLYKRVILMKWDITKALTTPKIQGIKWGPFCRKITYVESNHMFNHLHELMILHHTPLAKATTNGLTKSILLIKSAKYKSADRTYRGQENPFSKLIEGTNIVTGEVKIFHGLKEAATYVNGYKSLVANVISGANKTHKNWTFKHI